MKRNISAFFATTILLSMVFLFTSCMKDNCTRTYTIFTPVYTQLTTLRSAVQSKPAGTIVNTGKLYVKGNWIFLNEQNKGIHVIDNTDPSHPVKTSFINIPGNADMNIKGNTLYADMYCDLLAADISNPNQISVSKYLTRIFPSRAVYTTSANPDSIKVVTSWIQHDTTVSCRANLYMPNGCISCSTVPGGTSVYYLASTAGATSGQAGSMARFATVDNYMYAVTANDLNVIDISTANNPLFVKAKGIGWNIETIFPYNNKLFVGAGSSMSIFDLYNPADPAQSSWSGHWCSNDPVIADDNYAYVTLHESDICGSKVNRLEIYDLKMANSASLVKAYNLTNPQGLSKDGNLLFICDDGLKIYDATNALNIKLLKHITGAANYDVIATNGIAYVVAKDGLYQYDYSNVNDIRLLSKLSK